MFKKKSRQTKMETQHSKIWNTAKIVLRGKFIAINAYIKKRERSQINNLTIYTSRTWTSKTNPRVSKVRK